MDPPWGLLPADLKASWEDDALKSKLIDYYRLHNLSLVGNLTIRLYFWSHEHVHPPRLRLFGHLYTTTALRSSRLGVFSETLRNPLIDKTNRMKLFGRSFAIPAEKIQAVIQAAVHDETHKRVQHLISLHVRRDKTDIDCV